MDNERDSLGGFHMRIAAFDAGWVNATAEQEAPPTKDGGIDPKGWCAVRTLHNAHPTYISRLIALRTLHIAIAVIIHSFDRTRKKAGAQCAPYIMCTVHIVFSRLIATPTDAHV